MTNAERKFFDSCDTFKNYENLEQYEADVKKWLMLSDWHYTEETAEKIINSNAEYIKRAFEQRDSASDTGAEIGFSCG